MVFIAYRIFTIKSRNVAELLELLNIDKQTTTQMIEKNTKRWNNLEKGNPCEGLLEKTYGEVLADETLRKQLWKCLNSEVFGIDGLRFSCDESHTMSIKLPEQFFDRPDFLWGGKLSDTKLSNFHKTLKTLQKQFEKDLIVDSHAIPSSTRLQLRLEFPLTKFLRDKKSQINDITIGCMLQHLKDLWKKLTRKLKFDYKCDVF